jgi:hypothetical protein
MQAQTGNNSESMACTPSGGDILPTRSVPGAEHSALDKLRSEELELNMWHQSAAAAPNTVSGPASSPTSGLGSELSASTWATPGYNPAPESTQDTDPESAPESAKSSLVNGVGSSMTSGSATTTAPTPSSSANIRPCTRLQGGIRKSKVYTDCTICYGCLATAVNEPRSNTEALASDNWKKAMDNKISALMKNNTWHLVPPQYGRNIIDCK